MSRTGNTKPVMITVTPAEHAQLIQIAETGGLRSAAAVARSIVKAVLKDEREMDDDN